MTLRLNGSTSGYTEIDAPAAAGSNKIVLPNSNGNANQFLKNSGTAGQLQWSSVVEDSSGKVGIGTASPGAELQVNGQVLVTNGTNAVQLNASEGAIELWRSDSFAYIDFKTNSGEDLDCRIAQTSNGLAFTTGGDGATAERFRVDSSGNVGIGLNNPGAKLHISQTSQQVALTVESGGTGLQVVNNNSIGEVAVKAVDTTATNSKYLALYANPSGSSSGTEYLRITPDGVQIYSQLAPVSKSAAATLTIAELTNGIIQYTGAAATLTLPTGTLSDGVTSNLYNNMTFQWSVINTGSGTATIGAATGHTIVGVATVAASNAGRFATRRTGTNTWVTYRLSS